MSLRHFRMILLEDLLQVLDQGIAGLLDSLRCNLVTSDIPKHNVIQVFYWTGSGERGGQSMVSISSSSRNCRTHCTSLTVVQNFHPVISVIIAEPVEVCASTTKSEMLNDARGCITVSRPCHVCQSPLEGVKPSGQPSHQWPAGGSGSAHRIAVLRGLFDIFCLHWIVRVKTDWKAGWERGTDMQQRTTGWTPTQAAAHPSCNMGSPAYPQS